MPWRKKRFIFPGERVIFRRSKQAAKSRGEILNPLIGINRRSVFSLDEARALLPIVFRITRVYSRKVEELIERLDVLSGHNEALISALESQVNELIQDWQNKVQKLGALPKGLWIADFDAGDGYYCWKFPECTIEYWHDYNDGYTKRVSVDERVRVRSMRGLSHDLPMQETSE